MSATNTNVNANTNAYAAGTTADGSAGASGAQTLGDKVKGGWNGAGEAIRGNANSFLDNVGEQIAGRDPASQPQSLSNNGERPAGVAAQGADEIQSGMNNLKK
ncbi:hypothetical protein I316_02130 [Kwoniella heveanensis BCC8398]|uniref:Uncharacterized protein n=1 Tax=Kwoniella heveanensis BCC8398 TaxID=1296120 RepID=A0A1B9GZ08_9TREE|nr:hypothetical protein I316_02130 [Kwoniella heveanensis BCC8398]